jgi:hypothetical protein
MRTFSRPGSWGIGLGLQPHALPPHRTPCTPPSRSQGRDQECLALLCSSVPVGLTALVKAKRHLPARSLALSGKQASSGSAESIRGGSWPSVGRRLLWASENSMWALPWKDGEQHEDRKW